MWADVTDVIVWPHWGLDPEKDGRRVLDLVSAASVWAASASLVAW